MKLAISLGPVKALNEVCVIKDESIK